jgi:hypothetical protein
MNNFFNRRDFVKKSGLLTIGTAAGMHAFSSTGKVSAPKEVMSGIQIAPFNLLDEGIETVLDRLKELAEINTLFIYSHTYYGIPYTRTANVLADDHGIVQRDDKDRYFNPVWVQHNKSNFSNTSLWFKESDTRTEHAGRDVFAEVLKPARDRGIKVYARILEPGRLDVNERIHNFDSVTSVDIYGKIANEPCRNNPDHREFWKAMVTDLFKNYDLDGYQWGSERSGPLADLVDRALAPGCFCQHCMKYAADNGIDPHRAKKGFTILHETIRKSWDGAAKPHEEGFVYILGLMMKYPELLGWERLWRQAQEELFKTIYESIKTVKPSVEVGRHMASNTTTLNPIDKAAVDYAEMVTYTDFIKPILYHDVVSGRLKDGFIDRWRKGFLKGMSEEGTLEFFNMYNQYPENVVPALDNLDESGFSPEYIYHETKRLVDLANGKAAVYPGIGMNVPHRIGPKFIRTPDNPESIYNAVIKSFEAGATGVLASREYDEMRLPSLKAFGDGVRAIN